MGFGGGLEAQKGRGIHGRRLCFLLSTLAVRISISTPDTLRGIDRFLLITGIFVVSGSLYCFRSSSCPY